MFFILTLYKIYIQAGSLLLKINTEGKLPLVLEICQDSFVQLLPKRFYLLNAILSFKSFTDTYNYSKKLKKFCDIVHVHYENSSPVINKTQINENLRRQMLLILKEKWLFR